MSLVAVLATSTVASIPESSEFLSPAPCPLPSPAQVLHTVAVVVESTVAVVVLSLSPADVVMVPWVLLVVLLISVGSVGVALLLVSSPILLELAELSRSVETLVSDLVAGVDDGNETKELNQLGRNELLKVVMVEGVEVRLEDSVAKIEDSVVTIEVATEVEESVVTVSSVERVAEESTSSKEELIDDSG